MPSQADQTPRIEQLRNVAEAVLREEAEGQELIESREIILVTPEDILCLISNIEGAGRAIDNALTAMPEKKKKDKYTVEEKNYIYGRQVLLEELNTLAKLLDASQFEHKQVSYNARGIFPTKDVQPGS